jgi:hypothetical protein
LGLAAFLFCAFYSPHPPKDEKIIRNFDAHRAEFERLRIMLQQDTQLVTVADRGTRMRNGGSLPAWRYEEYMKQLKKVDGYLADRAEGEPAEPSIMLWGWGWAGHTKCLGICWLDQAPTNLVATFDDYKGRSWYGHPFIMYRHVETNWFLWTDL